MTVAKASRGTNESRRIANGSVSWIKGEKRTETSCRWSLENSPEEADQSWPHEAVCYLLAVRFNRELQRIFRERTCSIVLAEEVGWRGFPSIFHRSALRKRGMQQGLQAMKAVYRNSRCLDGRCISPQHPGVAEAKEDGSDSPAREPGLAFRFGHGKQPVEPHRADGLMPSREETVACERLRRARFRDL